MYFKFIRSLSSRIKSLIRFYKNISVSVLIGLIASFTLTTIFTFPLLLNLKNFNDGSEDYLFFDWLTQYNCRSILNGDIFNQTKYYATNQLYPFLNNLVYIDPILLPSTVLFCPLYIITGDNIFSLNTMLFIATMLNYISFYYVSRKLLKHKSSSILGAVIYAFSPVSLARLGGHVEHVQRFMIPLIIYFGYLYIEKPSILSLVKFIVVLYLGFLTNLQLSIFSLVFLCIAYIYLLIRKYKEKKLTTWMQKLLLYFPILIILLIPLCLLYFPYFTEDSFANFNISLEELKVNSAQIVDFITPQKKYLFGLIGLFPVWIGESIQKVWLAQNIERVVFMGFFPLILFFVSAVTIYKDFSINRGFSMFALIGSIISVLNSLGPNVIVFGLNLSPYMFLYKYAPYIDHIRSPARFMLVGIFFIAIVISFYFDELLRKKKYRSYVIIVISLVLLEMYQGINIIKSNIDFVNYNLEHKKVVFYPIAGSDVTSKYLSNSIKGNFTMINGYHGTSISEINNFFKKLNSEEVYSNRWYRQFAELGIDLIIIDLNVSKRHPLLHNHIKYYLDHEEVKRHILMMDRNWIVLRVE